MEYSQNVHYREVQKFDQWWFRLLMLLPIIGAVIGFRSGVNSETLFAGVVALIVVIMFLNMKLISEVYDDRIVVWFMPFHVFKPRTYLFSDIDRAFGRTYRPILEYGGWGIKYGKGGMSYTVSGTEGFQIVLRNDKKVLIGSKHVQEFESVFKNLNT